MFYSAIEFPYNAFKFPTLTNQLKQTSHIELFDFCNMMKEQALRKTMPIIRTIYHSPFSCLSWRGLTVLVDQIHNSSWFPIVYCWLDIPCWPGRTWQSPSTSPLLPPTHPPSPALAPSPGHCLRHARENTVLFLEGTDTCKMGVEGGGWRGLEHERGSHQCNNMYGRHKAALRALQA